MHKIRTAGTHLFYLQREIVRNFSRKRESIPWIPVPGDSRASLYAVITDVEREILGVP